MELDKKLGNIIYELNVEPEDCDAIVEQIKQAFVEAGWSTPVNQDDLINFGTEENPVMIHKDSLPFSPSEGGGYIDIPKDLRMTGPEWLARFEKELKHDTRTTQNECPECGAPYNWEEAARRASGVKK